MNRELLLRALEVSEYLQQETGIEHGVYVNDFIYLCSDNMNTKTQITSRDHLEELLRKGLEEARA